MNENNKSVMEYISSLSRVTRRKRGRGHHHNSRRNHEHDLSAHILPVGAFFTLEAIIMEGEIRLSDLADKLGIRVPSLTEKISKLEQHQLINRMKSEADSRVTVISITNHGKTVYEHSKLFYEKQDEKLNALLTPEESKQFGAICEKLIAFFESEHLNNKSNSKE